MKSVFVHTRADVGSSISTSGTQDLFATVPLWLVHFLLISLRKCMDGNSFGSLHFTDNT
jgi:hypothetical protein